MTSSGFFREVTTLLWISFAMLLTGLVDVATGNAASAQTLLIWAAILSVIGVGMTYKEYRAVKKRPRTSYSIDVHSEWDVTAIQQGSPITVYHDGKYQKTQDAPRPATDWTHITLTTDGNVASVWENGQLVRRVPIRPAPGRLFNATVV